MSRGERGERGERGKRGERGERGERIDRGEGKGRVPLRGGEIHLGGEAT